MGQSNRISCIEGSTRGSVNNRAQIRLQVGGPVALAFLFCRRCAPYEILRIVRQVSQLSDDDGLRRSGVEEESWKIKALRRT
jgi:hypothetical protein